MREEIKEIIYDIKDSLNETPKKMYKYTEITFNLNELSEMLKYVEQLEKENKELNRMCELYGQSLYNADLTKAEKKVEQLENIRKEAIEFMKENCDIITIDKGWIIRSELTTTGLGKLFKILNKGE